MDQLKKILTSLYSNHYKIIFLVLVGTLITAIQPAAAQIAYKFDTIAQTGLPVYDPISKFGNLAAVTALGTGPSINDKGRVAFIASAGSDIRVMVDDNGKIVRNHFIYPFQTIYNYLQIDNIDHVVYNFFDNRSGEPTYQDTEIIRVENDDGGTIMAYGSYVFSTPFDTIVAPTTMNNNDGVAFAAIPKSGGVVIGYNQDTDATNPDAVSGLLGGPIDQNPALSDTGRTVVRRGDVGTYQYLMFPSLNLDTAIIFADNTQYAKLGRRPGITDDGRVIVFVGQHTTLGYGLFEAAVNSSNQFIFSKVATLPSDVDLDRRVTINHVNGGSGFNYRIVYISKNATGPTLNTIDVDVSNPNTPVFSNPTIVVESGKPFAPLTGNVTNVFTYDSVNNFGQLAFIVQTASGSAVVRATPSAAAATAPQQAPCPNSVSTADPVFLHSGQFHYGCTDLVIPGREVDLVISHQYVGQTAQVSQFGFGWSMSYNERLNVLKNGSAEISDGAGRKDVYALSGTQYIAPAGFYQTLVKNSDLTWTLTNRDGSQKLFDTLGRLSKTLDRHNNAITLEYDAGGKLPIVGPNVSGTGARQVIGEDYRLIKITGSNGRIVNLTYNADGLLSTIKDATTGRTVTFTYDAALNDLLKITKTPVAQITGGVAKSFTYDKHNLLTIKDGKSQTFVTNVYDAQNRVSKQTNGSGFYTFVYATKKTTVTDRKGFITVYDFNDTGNLLKSTQQTKGLRTGEPASFITNYTYNTNKEITLITYPRGNGIVYKYDTANTNVKSRGNLIEVRQKTLASAADNDTNDIVVKYTYETRFNQVKTITDAMGKVTTYTYDYELATTDPSYGTQGNLVRITQPTVGTSTPVTSFMYNANGQPVKITDPNGNITTMTYNATTGYLTTVSRDPSGINAATQFAYDNFGNINKITDANSKPTSFVYNEMGWLISTTNALTRMIKYTHDANGNVTKEERQSDAGATTWQTFLYTYDTLNHVLTIKDPLNRTTTFTYDANENLMTESNPKLNVTNYTYDERDLLFKVTDPNTGVTQYDYDTNGLLSTLSDAKANKTTYAYDGFNRLIKMTYADTTKFEQYTYDKNGNLTKRITPAAQTINYVYDALNRLTSQTYTDTTMNVTRTYDIGSRLTGVTNSFSTIAFTYDKLNRVATDSQKFGTLAAFVVTNVYDKVGNKTKVTYPAGKVVDYVYNAMNQVSNVKVNTVALANYTYDLLNRLSQKDLVGTATKSAVYGYDVANQLLTVDNKIISPVTQISKHTYTYDANGNRMTHANLTGGVTKSLSFTYSKLDELLTSTGAQAHTYVYDKVGNRTTADAVAYVSNNLNQYTTVGGVALTYDANGNMTKDNAGTTYIYDAENRLTQVTKGTVVSKYAYDGFNRRISKLVGTLTTFFVHDGNDVIQERNSTGGLVADYVYGPRIDEVLTMTRGTTTYYYFYDALGNVRQITDAAGVIGETYDYDLYGKPTLVSTKGNPYLFNGRWYDSESGNYYYRARYYQPTLGRFLQRDPIGYTDGMNVYKYVKNNPGNFIDPLGLWYIDINVSWGWMGAVGTGGIIFSDKGVYNYMGGGGGTWGPGGGVTWSPNDPTIGWNGGVQVGTPILLGGQWGQVEYQSGKKDYFKEYGLVFPGVSVTAYYVKAFKWPWEKDKKTPCSKGTK